MNVVVFNLPEGTYPSGYQNKQYDEDNIRTIAEVNIETTFRLGKKTEAKSGF